jgi:hypothetical protein
MLSHDFARLLLKRRNMDMHFVVNATLPGHDDDESPDYRVAMADDRHREIGAEGPPPEILRYDSEHDFLEVALGWIFLGRQGSYTLTPEEARMVIGALFDAEATSHPDDRAGRERIAQLRNKIRAESR